MPLTQHHHDRPEERFMPAHLKVLHIVALVAAAATACPTMASAESATLSKIKSANAITLGYRESSIPFSYLGADQKPIGISMDLCAAIVERIKTELKLATLAVNHTAVNSSNRIPLIQNGTVDIECGGTANNLTRQKQVAFSVATFVSQPRWLTKATSGTASVAALKGKTVVVTQGSNAVGFAQEINAKESLGFNIVQAKDHAESLLMVDTGRAVAFLEDDILLAGLKAGARNPVAFAFLPEAYDKIYYGLMFPKDDPEFKTLVDGVLSAMMASGEFTRLYDKWFAKPIPPKNQNLDFPMSDALKERVAHPSDKVDS
jgi:glutamate/aspartate transport system substrate-binding protein